MSSSGVLAAGAANGQLWAGFGGEKSPSPGSAKKKKKRRYWEGLKDDDESIWVTVAQGPVVGVCVHVIVIQDQWSHRMLTLVPPFRLFTSSSHIVTCSLGGKLTGLRISADGENPSRTVEEIWAFDSANILKVNSLKVGSTSADSSWIVIGGLNRIGRGIAEIYRLPPLPSWCVIRHVSPTSRV